MTKDLQTRIDERKARLAALDLERASLLGEIRAYEYAQRQMISPTTARRSAPRADSSSSPRRGRLFIHGWGEILLTASVNGNQTFGFREVQQAAVTHLGHELAALKARSQIADYVSAGYLNRLSPGEFQVSPKGLDALVPFVQSQGTNTDLLTDSDQAETGAESGGAKERGGKEAPG